MKDKNKNGVATIGTIVTVSLAIIGWLFMSINRVDDKATAALKSNSDLRADISGQMSDLRSQVSATAQDVSWIRQLLSSGSSNFKSFASSTKR